MDPVTEARVRTGIRLPLMILTEAGRIDRATSIAGNPRESRHKAAFSSSACNESEPGGAVKKGGLRVDNENLWPSSQTTEDHERFHPEADSVFVAYWRTSNSEK